MTKKNAPPAPEATYSDPPRSTESVTVDKRNPGKDRLSVTWSNGWSYLIPEGIEKHFNTGTRVLIETVLFSEVVGLQVAGEWVWRLSDQDRAKRIEEMLAESEARRSAELEENRDDWDARTKALPDWLREPLESLLNDPEKGEEFQQSTWGYQLTSSELADLYYRAGTETLQEPEPEDVTAFADKHGTTGYMHAWAISVARAHRIDVAAAGGTTPTTKS